MPKSSSPHAGMPRDGDRESKRDWRGCVRRQQSTIDGPVWLDIAVSTGLSLEGLLKPIIDGLDPILGGRFVGDTGVHTERRPRRMATDPPPAAPALRNRARSRTDVGMN